MVGAALRFLGLLLATLAGLLFLPWGVFALWAAVTFNNGGSLWTHPGIVQFLKVEAVLAGAAVLLLGIAALARRAAPTSRG
jgi:hypothetical protein